MAKDRSKYIPRKPLSGLPAGAPCVTGFHRSEGPRPAPPRREKALALVPRRPSRPARP